MPVETFPDHVAKDCLGAGVWTVTRMAHFHDEQEVLATVFHATKCQLLSLLRTSPVSPEGVMRVYFEPEMKDAARGTATLHDWTTGPGERSPGIDRGRTGKLGTRY